MEAFCTVCEEPTLHVSHDDDPGRCACTVCGHEQPLVVPLE